MSSQAVVLVSGGVVNAAYTDDPDLKIRIIDYDVEGSTHPTIREIVEPNGTKERASINEVQEFNPVLTKHFFNV